MHKITPQLVCMQATELACFLHNQLAWNKLQGEKDSATIRFPLSIVVCTHSIFVLLIEKLLFCLLIPVTSMDEQQAECVAQGTLCVCDCRSAPLQSEFSLS